MEEQRYLYKPNHTTNLNNMRLMDKWCDLIIKVNEMEFRAHKMILAANLKYFDTMLSNDSFQESKKGIVYMESVEEPALEAFLNYAYTGEMLITHTNVLSLLELADYLNEDAIKNSCVEFLVKHLKQKDTLRAYTFAKASDCFLLKNAAKEMLLMNFEDFSKSTQYNNLDSKNLIDILSNGKSQTVAKQQVIFEAIFRWIMQDMENRTCHTIDLLSCINISGFTADYLLNYLYGQTIDSDDKYGIKNNVMHYYHRSRVEKEKQGKALIVLCNSEHRLTFQFYKFIEHKWSPLQEITETHIDMISNCAIVNDKLYYTIYESEKFVLQVYNPMTKRTTTLNSSSAILPFSAVCACNRFVYLCGGQKHNGHVSSQVLRYDTETDFFDVLPPMKTAREQAAATLYQGGLHVLGGSRNWSSSLDSVERFDFVTMQWTSFATMCESRCLHAVAVLDGKLYACGGDSRISVEVYSPLTNRWQKLATPSKSKFNFPVIAHEDKLLAIGGSNRDVEVYDPCKNEWQIDEELSSGLQIYFPRGGLISASCIQA